MTFLFTGPVKQFTKNTNMAGIPMRDSVYLVSRKLMTR